MTLVFEDEAWELPLAPTRSQVEADLLDWERRLNVLLDQIECWAAVRSDLRPIRGNVHRAERKMRLVGIVGTRPLPNLILQKYDPNGHPTDTMVHIGPDARWVIGTRGQISIRTPKTIYTVADGGRPGAPEWFCTSLGGLPPPHFTQELLLTLLADAA